MVSGDGGLEMSRVYLPSWPELIDRMTIVQLKAIFIPENKKSYDEEINLILKDIDTILQEKDYRVTASDIRAMSVLAISNRFIWENESKARSGGREQDHLLRATHAVNGVRNTAKNILAMSIGDRLDYKVDCIACDLPEGAGNWQIWPAEKT